MAGPESTPSAPREPDPKGPAVADRVVPTARVSAPRFRPLDVFRFVAVCLMVQGHAFTALLASRITDAPWYRVHTFVHGFTAPMFLFGAGMAFSITTLRKWESHVSYGPAMARRLGRYGWILAIGYALHFPMVRIRDWATAPPGTFESFFQVDALQVIGVTMVFCVLLVWLARKPPTFLWAVALALIFVTFGAPWAWRVPADAGVPLPVAAYLNGRTGSLFPVFPWAGFVFAGVLTGAVVARTRRKPRAFSWRLVAAAVGILALGLVLDGAGADAWLGPHRRWESGPFLFTWRVGVLLGVLGFTALADAFTVPAEHIAAPGPFSRVVRTLSQESLVVYVVHLLLLYGTPGFGGFRGARGEGWDVLPALGAVAVLFLVGGGAAFAFARLRDQHPNAFRRVKALAVVGAALALAARF